MKKIITTDKAPAPIGPYNQAVLLGNLLYTSGQIAINPKTGALEIDDIEKETKLVMENSKAILEEAGMTFENVITLVARIDIRCIGIYIFLIKLVYKSTWHSFDFLFELHDHGFHKRLQAFFNDSLHIS